MIRRIVCRMCFRVFKLQGHILQIDARIFWLELEESPVIPSPMGVGRRGIHSKLDILERAVVQALSVPSSSVRCNLPHTTLHSFITNEMIGGH
jgi:hypothetical protein